MADGGLKCFASLADQFIRKGVDPAPLAENGLSSELLARLSQVSASGCRGFASVSRRLDSGLGLEQQRSAGGWG